MFDDPIKLILSALVIVVAVLFFCIEFLRGRLDKQTEIIGALVSAVRRLEARQYGSRKDTEDDYPTR